MIWAPLILLVQDLIIEAIGGLPGRGERHPDEQDKLEGIVEGWRPISVAVTLCAMERLTEPVDSIDGALKNREEGEHHPVLCRPIISLMSRRALENPGNRHSRSTTITR